MTKKEKTKTKDEEIQYLALMLTATRKEDKERMISISKRLAELAE